MTWSPHITRYLNLRPGGNSSLGTAVSVRDVRTLRQQFYAYVWVSNAQAMKTFHTSPSNIFNTVSFCFASDNLCIVGDERWEDVKWYIRGGRGKVDIYLFGEGRRGRARFSFTCEVSF